LRELCPQLIAGQTVGAGHFHQLETPEQVNAMIDRFLTVTLNGRNRWAKFPAKPQGDGYFNLAHWELLLEPQGQATRLTQRFSYQPQNGVARRMVDAAGANGLEQACAVSLGQLNQRLERNVAVTASVWA
jgi:hypothetical protein